MELQYSSQELQETKNFVLNERKKSIKHDLFRHYFLIIKIYLGLSKDYSKEDIPWLLEFCIRLQTLINKEHENN